ncbi:MAG: hypothetical protein H0V88_14735 [Pyrinomonadaceae bacterium]|nr:hypothetical protein [Pyrinomonadaceae bacterium]
MIGESVVAAASAVALGAGALLTIAAPVIFRVNVFNEAACDKVYARLGIGARGTVERQKNRATE